MTINDPIKDSCANCGGTGVIRFSWFPPVDCPRCLGTGKTVEEIKKSLRKARAALDQLSEKLEDMKGDIARIVEERDKLRAKLMVDWSRREAELYWTLRDVLDEHARQGFAHATRCAVRLPPYDRHRDCDCDCWLARLHRAVGSDQ